VSLSLDELITPLTSDQVLETWLAALEVLGIPARSWRPGGAFRTILRVLATTYAGFTTLVAAFIRSGFLDLASGPWLTLLARYVYGVERIPATFASGDVVVTNTGGGVFEFAAGEVTFLGTTTSPPKAYTNAAPFSLGPGQIATVAIVAVERGAASSAPPSTITALQTTLLGVIVTNPTAVVGTEEQTDADLVQTCKDKLAARSPNGPRGAYAFAIRRATRPNGAPVDINRSQISTSSSTGTVTIWIASPSGAPIDEDLAAVAASVEAVARPDTVTVDVLAATAVALTQALTVWATKTDGLSATDLGLLVSRALASMIAAYPIGGLKEAPSTRGFLFAAMIIGTAKAAHPSIFDVRGVASDLPILDGQVASLAATVTVRIASGAS